ncbi:hypothetical protein HIM_00963 [Hirsutella minnesotensis 3608]|nr:hypothetical protein HIM_00963 [Hirsutella minnesotensis 3608]
MSLDPAPSLDSVPCQQHGPWQSLATDHQLSHLPAWTVSGPSTFGSWPPQFSTLDLTSSSSDVVFFCMGFETLCRAKIYAHTHRDGRVENYRYNPVTEVGIAIFDMRLIRNGDRKLSGGWRIPPMAPMGERGSGWYRWMHRHHWIVDEYSSHRGSRCTSRRHREQGTGHAKKHSTKHSTESCPYAFGMSKRVKEADLSQRIRSMWENAQALNRTPDERRAKTKRQVIFLSWNLDPELRIMYRMGLKIWIDADMLDLRRHPLIAEIARASGGEFGFREAMEALGLPTDQVAGRDFLHNAGNDAVFELQIFFALIAVQTDAGALEVVRAGRALAPIRRVCSSESPEATHSSPKVSRHPSRNRARR